MGLIALAILLMLTAAILIGRRHVAEQPMRMIYLLELEVATLVLAIVVLLAATVNAVAWTSDHYDSKGLAYCIGLVAGGVLGFVSRDLFKSGENDSRAAVHYQARVVKIYRPYFYDPSIDDPLA